MNLKTYLPFLSWPRPTGALLRGEASAGLMVALVMVPQSVAYAALAGMPLVTGLYAALLPLLVAVLFGSSTRLSVGPAALTCVLIAASLTGLAQPGSPQWVALAVWLALMSGAIQLAMGAGGFAWVLNLINAPVLMAFTQAAALLIAASQLPALLGLRGPLMRLLEQPSFDFAAMAIGLASLAALVLGKRRAPQQPWVLWVVAGAAAVSYASGFAASGSAVVGSLPAGLPSLYLPDWIGWNSFNALLLPAVMIAFVSFLETASSAKTEAQRDGKHWNDNQDLIGQGLAKLASALCGSFATSTSFSRSAITLYAGAKTGWATVTCAGFVFLALLLLTPLLYHVPRAALAAIVVAAVTSLLKPESFVQVWRINRAEALVAAITFGVTLLSAPRIYWGVLTGVLLGLAHFLYHRLHPRIIEVGLHADGSLRDRHLWSLPPLAPHLYALRMDSGLDFAAASGFERAIVTQLTAHPDLLHVCLFAQAINRVDATGVETFMRLRQTLEKRGITLHISGIKLPVETVLLQSGALKENGFLKMYRTDAEALVGFGHHA
jgi:sulfate permease, SulP family